MAPDTPLVIALIQITVKLLLCCHELIGNKSLTINLEINRESLTNDIRWIGAFFLLTKTDNGFRVLTVVDEKEVAVFFIQDGAFPFVFHLCQTEERLT